MTIEIGRYRETDRAGVEALYRQVFGAASAAANRRRWDWQYRANPGNPSDAPEIWIAREGETVVGQYATMPVQMLVDQRRVAGSWGMDVMVAPRCQRQGLGEHLFRTWDEHVGASLGLGLSEASYRLFKKLDWPDVGPVPCWVKPLTRRALARPGWPALANLVVSTIALPLVRALAARGERSASHRDPPRETPRAIGARHDEGDRPARVRPIERFDDGFTRLWARVAPKLDLAVRRDAEYLNWKFFAPPHLQCSVVTLRRGADTAGYAVYRHVAEPRGRATLLVDFLVDPDDDTGFGEILAWIDREAHAVGSDRIRCYAMHAGFGRVLRRRGYFRVRSTLEFVLKINAFEPAADLYRHTSRWHVTLGDSDQDR